MTVAMSTQGVDIAAAGYQDLTGSGYEMFTIDGVSLVDKVHLLGVPHVITAVTYQRTKPETLVAAKKRGEAPPRGFVSVEATIADEAMLARCVARGLCPGVSDVTGLLVDPNERVVYNDGSTGIRRQITKLLHSFGIIRVATEITTDRGFDVPFGEWEWNGDQLSQQGTDDDDNPIMVPRFEKNHNGDALLIHVRRGLYVSKYGDNDESETFYLK